MRAISRSRRPSRLYRRIRQAEWLARRAGSCQRSTILGAVRLLHSRRAAFAAPHRKWTRLDPHSVAHESFYVPFRDGSKRPLFARFGRVHVAIPPSGRGSRARSGQSARTSQLRLRRLLLARVLRKHQLEQRWKRDSRKPRRLVGSVSRSVTWFERNSSRSSERPRP